MRASKSFKFFVNNLIIVVIVAGCSTSSTQSPTPPATKETGIKTKFVSDGKLSDSEVKQVVALAQLCGIQEVGEIETFYYLPTSITGISVKSKEYVDGRNTSYETLVVKRIGGKYRKPTTSAVTRGNFWADKSEKFSTLTREYQINEKPVQIKIGKNVDFALADKVIPLIFAKKLRFGAGRLDKDLAELFIRDEPDGLYRTENGEYELVFKVYIGSWRILRFKLIGEEIFITGEEDLIA